MLTTKGLVFQFFESCIYYYSNWWFYTKTYRLGMNRTRPNQPLAWRQTSHSPQQQNITKVSWMGDCDKALWPIPPTTWHIGTWGSCKTRWHKKRKQRSAPLWKLVLSVFSHFFFPLLSMFFFSLYSILLSILFSPLSPGILSSSYCSH